MLLPGLLQIEQTWCEKQVGKWREIFEQVWNNGISSQQSSSQGNLKDFEFAKEYLELIAKHKYALTLTIFSAKVVQVDDKNANDDNLMIMFQFKECKGIVNVIILIIHGFITYYCSGQNPCSQRITSSNQSISTVSQPPSPQLLWTRVPWSSLGAG